MSAAASASPSVVRSASTAHRPQGSPSDRPQRAQSTATRPSAGPASPQRSQSHSQRPPSSSGQGNLTNVARRDFEQTNLARPPSSRRSSSRDGTQAPPGPTRTDSTRSGNRNASRPGHTRYASDASTANAVPINGVSADTPTRHPPGSSGGPRRRTEIEASTGKWQLLKTIGAGSMGKVKLARNQETGEQVAVKIVPRQSTDEHRNAQDRERADHSKEVRTAREAAIVSLVNHPYICGMRDVVRTNYHWYMLFEYVNGGQMLDYIISHGRLKEKQARKFGRQIASALDYCHRNSIVHRDLKIENILISKTGDIKIIDFGLSNLFSPRNFLKTFCGSLYFAAPELLQAKQYTGPEVDVWSFGIVLYVLVCGKVPFDDHSMPQLHAKIKKGFVEYPPWLSTECKHLISRMLVTDPKQRASLSEIMNHQWITKGFNTPPENYLPAREPLQLPLDPQVIDKMQGFDFGSADFIETQLTKIIESEDYQLAVRSTAKRQQAQVADADKKSRGVFDFYKRRNSTTSRDTLTNPSAEAVQLGADPVNAFSPLISVYFLVREKQERERHEANPGALSMPKSPGEKPLKMPDLPAPEAAYTNSSSYEMSGEKTGGRSRPRARTHGEDEVSEDLKKMNLNVPGQPPPPAIQLPSDQSFAAKKEGGGFMAGLGRRLSTRRGRGPPSTPPPALAVSGPTDGAGDAPVATPRKSMSVRRTRDREPPLSASNLNAKENRQQPELLSPPGAGASGVRKYMGLGRSTSVNSGDFRRRGSRRGASETAAREPPPTSGSEKSGLAGEALRANDAASDDAQESSRPRKATSRTKSLGHARRESIQARRQRREMTRESDVPEETDQEIAGETEPESRSPDTAKPVYLKGLFSVSTTSSKPLQVIRADIVRVLKELGVEYYEIKGGFSCRHAPSIDLNPASEKSPASPGQQSTGAGSHRRKISFGGFMDRDKDREEFREQQKSPQTPRSARPRANLEPSYTETEDSDESDGRDHRQPSRPRAAGETTTHVQHDTGESLILKFEIVIVKVPLLTLHGIQFKKVDGGTWQYKNMADKILKQLRL